MNWGIPLELNARGYNAIPVGTRTQRMTPPGWFRRVFRLGPVVMKQDEPNGTPWYPGMAKGDVYAVRFPEGDPAYGAVRRAMQGL